MPSPNVIAHRAPRRRRARPGKGEPRKAFAMGDKRSGSSDITSEEADITAGFDCNNQFAPLLSTEAAPGTQEELSQSARFDFTFRCESACMPTKKPHRRYPLPNTPSEDLVVAPMSHATTSPQRRSISTISRSPSASSGDHIPFNHPNLSTPSIHPARSAFGSVSHAHKPRAPPNTPAAATPPKVSSQQTGLSPLSALSLAADAEKPSAPPDTPAAPTSPIISHLSQPTLPSPALVRPSPPKIESTSSCELATLPAPPRSPASTLSRSAIFPTPDLLSYTMTSTSFDIFDIAAQIAAAQVSTMPIVVFDNNLGRAAGVKGDEGAKNPELSTLSHSRERNGERGLARVRRDRSTDARLPERTTWLFKGFVDGNVGRKKKMREERSTSGTLVDEGYWSCEEADEKKDGDGDEDDWETDEDGDDDWVGKETVFWRGGRSREVVGGEVRVIRAGTMHK
ncbi:hypothetical protein MMC28_000522 [Mycoblastus sanguinarius]|nr:hypothetical protein [Mycoblastus sanguinarius]